MAHDVFISYSIKDRLLADALCHKLEEDSIRCWIAPRDISPGGSWAGEIADAIPNSKIMILVFSANANASKQVLREVELAITNNLTVIPIKIEDVTPTGGMSYYLSTTHWIDAIGNKFDKRINTLSNKIQAMLGIDAKEEIKHESVVSSSKSASSLIPNEIPFAEHTEKLINESQKTENNAKLTITKQKSRKKK
ncbi:MAG: toll/interleukin-1 receptor domain-containing protein, partial [Clostridiales bacterium]|nr:toll/interleukin-1 receptor domain-containing protein [Clostridiales bacterium]